jgi:hypothetical protein
MAKAPTITLNDPQDTMIQKKAKATVSTSVTKLSRTEKEWIETVGLEVLTAVEMIARTGTPADLAVHLVKRTAINGRGVMVIRNGKRERNKMKLVLAET